MSDLADCWESKQQGFAAAADMIGKLLSAWEESQRDIRTLEDGLALALNHWDGHPEDAYAKAQGALLETRGTIPWAVCPRCGQHWQSGVGQMLVVSACCPPCRDRQKGLEP